MDPVTTRKCAHEDKRCVNHGSGEWPIIEVVRDADGFTKEVTHLMVVYVMDGKVDLSFGTTDSYPLDEGSLMLFPPGIRLTARKTAEPATIVILKIKNLIVLCDRYIFSQTWHDTEIHRLRHTHLEANERIMTYMKLLVEDVTGPLHCYRFMEMKILELFHLLRTYYTPRQLAMFTQPLISSDAQFMHFIWSNYRKVHNVAQFAEMGNSSLSNFKMKFKRVTGLAPSHWLEEQKVRNVFHEVVAGEKTFKEISREYHFSSLSHMGTFCKKHFGTSPGSLRANSGKAAKIPQNNNRLIPSSHLWM
jgi:AraC-like DNA-binding protein